MECKSRFNGVLIDFRLVGLITVLWEWSFTFLSNSNFNSKIIQK